MAGVGNGGQPARERTILVVDDDLRQLAALRRQARGRGRMFVAATAKDALELALSERPEIAIVDYFLGSTRGIDLIAPLRDIDPTIRVVVVSGVFTAAIAEKVTRAGADAVMEKPFDVPFVLRRIDEGPDAQQLPQELRTLAEVEVAHIRRILVLCDFNVTRAAKYLGVQPNTVRARMKKAGIATVINRAPCPRRRR